MIVPTTTKGAIVSSKEKQVQKLTAGEKIVFTRGGDTETQTGTVRSVEVNGKYVTIWYHTDADELSMVLAEKGDAILISK